MYDRGLSATEPTIDEDRTLGADDAPASVYGYDDLSRGDSVGRYLVLRPLGRGGMGAVYAAHDPELDRTVALKIVLRRGNGTMSLKDEAQTLARFSHPNVVSVHDVGELPRGVFIAMEYVPGKTLRWWAREHKDDLAGLARVMREAGKGLAAAHAQGLVHLDFKPDNVMIADDGRVLVLDFGLAKPQERTGSGTDVAPAGTPAYMAPEQHLREPFDHRADQFAFCVTWLECALGRRPFGGATPSAIARAILEGDLDLPPRPSGLPRRTWEALLRGLSVDVDARWPDLDGLLEATTPPSSSRRQTLAAVLVAGSLGAAGTWVVANSDARCRGAGTRVAEVWSSAQAESLRARAPEGLPAPRAAQIVTRLDAYADVLAEGYREACRVAAEDMPRQVCLDARTEQLRAARDVALEAEASALENVFDGLEDVRACRRADEEALYREVSDPARGQALLQRLARGRALTAAGRHGDARTVLDGVAEEARVLGWRGVEASARASLAEVVAYGGDKAEMQVVLDDALRLAAEAGSDAVTFEVMQKLVQEHALAGDAAAVQALAPALQAATIRAGRSGSSVRVAEGNVLQLTGDYDGAQAAYEEALQADPPTSTRVRVQSNLGGIALYRGEFVEAKALFEEALPASVEEHGASAVATLKLEANLADADQQLGNVAAAKERYAVALGRYRDAGAGDSRPAQHLALNYATAMLASGDIEGAATLGEPAARRMLEMHGDAHVFSIAARDFLNSLALQRGQAATSLAGTRSLLTDLDALLGKDSALSAFLRLNIARATAQLGQVDEGLASLAAAEPLFVTLHPEHPALVGVFRLRAELLLEQGTLEGAKAAATEAVRRSGNASVAPIERGRAHLIRARVALAQGATTPDVRLDLEVARDAFATLPSSPDARVDEVAALLEG